MAQLNLTKRGQQGSLHRRTINVGKIQLINELADQRRQDPQTSLTRKYKQVGDFHNGVHDHCGFVSPWTKSANNVNSPIMIIAQDWSSEEALARPPKNTNLGHDPALPTNRNLAMLLQEYFGMQFSDVYATNIFVFVKSGSISSRIPKSDLVYSAKTYTLAEIEIVKPQAIICLGKATFDTLCKATGNKVPPFKESSKHPVHHNGSLIFGVPHTGGFGTKNAGGLDAVRKIWKTLSKTTGANSKKQDTQSLHAL